MKNVLPLLILLLFVEAYSVSRQVDYSKNIDSVKTNTRSHDDLCKRWVLDYGLNNGLKIQGLPSSPAFDYEFNSDGTYKLYHSNDKFTSGKWEYKDECSCYKLRRPDGEISGQIKLISKTKFVTKPDGVALSGFSKGLEYHYIPKTDK